ncbi:hypothetical protein L228DRAFT_236552 [Xylona heveae TC161]|uniref:Xylanolytic transcriptional activator regulatory domain-containing protein n=1 Tax=Xylona heveae (strain CBS 132557 / TC161) TaxID=1328760 RepID=A0A161TGX3_XYLHT|nr:hypothetical protein L228DRAFT_236552 [Xylona heveae TC161]KZF25457.1 hypothetical protein L228DRAFT_236552 [Xylona heveae TC161]
MCDGEEPCARCVSRDISETCHYDVNVKTAKEDLIRMVKDLEEQNTGLQGTNEELQDKYEGMRVRHDDYKEKAARIESILAALRANGQGDEIIRRLKEGQTYRQISHWLGRPVVDDVDMLSPTSERKLIEALKRSGQASPDYFELPISVDLIEKWTAVTTDQRLVQHLLALYFTWIHPVHMFFSEALFLESFHSGDTKYCSSSLVNALCAMSCVIFDEHEDVPALSLAQEFLEQAETAIRREGQSSFPTFQALAIMFLVELSIGSGARAWPYLRLAADSINSVVLSNAPLEAQRIYLQGIETLDATWAWFTYQISTPPVNNKAAPFPDGEPDVPPTLWKFYRTENDREAADIPSFEMETARERAKLYTLVQKTVNLFCGSDGNISARSLMQIYREFLSWKTSLPPVLVRGNPASAQLPHVLLLHMEFHAGIIHLFHPLSTCEKFILQFREQLQRFLLDHARAGLDLAASYASQYSSRYQLPVHSFCLLNFSEIILRYDPESAVTSDLIGFCLEAFDQAGAGFKICRPLLHMFLKTVRGCGLGIPGEHARFNVPSRECDDEELLKACGRLTTNQPVTEIMERIEPTMAQDLAEEWQKLTHEHSSGRRNSTSESMLKINALLND